MTEARAWLRLASLVMLAALTACGGGGGGGGGNGNGNGNGGGNGGATPTLTVQPTQVAVEPQQTVTITPTTTNVTSPAFTFVVTPPAALQTETAAEIARRFGSVNAQGVFTAGTDAEAGLRGTVTVRETNSSLQREVSVQIVPAIQRVTVAPTDQSVLAGQTVTYTATAIDFFNEPVPNVLVDWRVTGGVGTISASGVFTATQAGTGQIEARVGLANPGTASVTVVGSIVGLTISPLGNPVEVETGTQRQFQAFVRDAQGNQAPAQATWQLSNPALGSISATGLFTAGAVGQSGNLVATAQGQTATVPLRTVALLTPPGEQPANLFGTVRTGTGSGASGATVVALDATEQEVARTTADSDGKYRLFLPAGTYTVRATLGASSATRTGVELASQDVRLQVDLTLVAS